MWYFSWLLGLPVAAGFAVINAMWLELREDAQIIETAEREDAERLRKG